MKERTTKQLALISGLCGCLLLPLATTAQAPSQGILVRDWFLPEYPEESHPKKLQTVMAITQEMVGSEGATHPLYFGFRYANGLGDGEENTKVIFKAEVYRGEERLWKVKRARKPDEYGDHRYLHCKTYDGGLLPGDLVVFTYKFKKAPRPGEVDLIRLSTLVAPAELWEEDPWGIWPSGEQFSDCR